MKVNGPVSFFLNWLWRVTVYVLIVGSLAFLASILLGGCHDYDRLPRQTEAEITVWRIIYGDMGNPIPDVQWIRQDDLDCAPDKDGRFTGFYRWRWYGDVGKSSTCVGGVTWEDWQLCQVALPDGETFSTTAFAHELYHQYLHYWTGDGDPIHADPGFGIAFGHPYGTVDAANQALKDEGL